MMYGMLRYSYRTQMSWLLRYLYEYEYLDCHPLLRVCELIITITDESLEGA